MAANVGDIFVAQTGGTNGISATRWVVTSQVRVTAPLTGATNYASSLAIATAIHGLFETHFLPLLSISCQLNATRANRIEPAPGVSAVFVDAQVGGVSGDMMEPNTAVLISLRTDLPGRQGMGRRFIPCVPVASQSDGRLGNSEAMAFSDAAASMWDGTISVDGGSAVGIMWSAANYAITANTVTAGPVLLNVFTDRVLRRMTRRDFKNAAYVA